MTPQVACFGEILWDIFETRARGTAPISRFFRRELGGAPANVATGLARLGVRAAVVGGVGRDRFGDALIDHLRKDGVDVRSVVRLPNRTGLTFVVRDGRGEPNFLFYRHESADVSIRAEHITPTMGDAVWALVGTSTLMTKELAGATARFLDVAERQGAHLMVDLNVREHLWPDRRTMQRAIAGLAERASLVKASDADLRAVTGARGASESPLFRWLERHAPRASWLVTRGAGVASAIGEHGSVELPALRARCVDATGAGDAFIAGSLATLVAARALPGSSAWGDVALWRAALRTGHIMGKKAVSRAGAVAGLDRLGQASAAIERVRRSAR
ncbi:MAG: carbohydrate kinase [Polyangiaceae bacterium]